jgi:hypothetical protein
MDHLPGYDDWRTQAPEPDWGVCPECGVSQEDAERIVTNGADDEYLCPCGRVYSDDDAHPDPHDDEPQDFDEWRDKRGY